jgi:uncharacterized protein YjbJ (UPF0337 family)
MKMQLNMGRREFLDVMGFRVGRESVLNRSADLLRMFGYGRGVPGSVSELGETLRIRVGVAKFAAYLRNWIPSGGPVRGALIHRAELTYCGCDSPPIREGYTPWNHSSQLTRVYLPAPSGRVFVVELTTTENQKQEYTAMNTLEIKGDWNIAKGKLKQKWSALTDDDLQYLEGKQEELLGRIQKRTGETREAVEEAVKKASRDCCS